MDRPITAASDDGVCRWHAAELWQTRAIKYEIIEIKFDLHHRIMRPMRTAALAAIEAIALSVVAGGGFRRWERRRRPAAVDAVSGR